MLPPEEQPAAVDLNPFNLEQSPDFSSNSGKVFKTLDFEFTKVEKSLNESCELLISHQNQTDFEHPERKSETKSFKLEADMSPTTGFDSNVTNNSEQDDVITVLKELENGVTPEPSQMSDSIVRATFIDFSSGEEEEDPANRHGGGGGLLGEESKTEDLGKEFSLTLSPDLPKIRAQQIQNWLEFENKSEIEVNNATQDNDAAIMDETAKSREASPPHDFELDSLTMMGGDASAGGNQLGGLGVGDHTVTDADGLQRRVRFLTDPEGNILISVFLTKLVHFIFSLLKLVTVGYIDFTQKNDIPAVPLTISNELLSDEQSCGSEACLYEFDSDTDLEFNFCDSVDGEEEEQQQVIHIGHENGLPHGMNFPEIESQLAAFVSQSQQNKADLVDTDKILKELGVEKDDELEKDGPHEVKGDGDDDITEAGEEVCEKGRVKTRISVASSLSIFDDGEDVGSDSETMSTSSCSSMIEVKPKENETLSLSDEQRDVNGYDENNNEVKETGCSVDAEIEEVEKHCNGISTIKEEDVSTEDVQLSSPSEDVNASQEMTQNSQALEELVDIVEKPKISEAQYSSCPKNQHEIPDPSAPASKSIPKLVDIELKNQPSTTTIANNKPHTAGSSAFLKAVENNGTSKTSIHSNENVVTVQVEYSSNEEGDTPSPTQPTNQFYDQAEQQLESLCIEEEPISAVALTIAKWEKFSRKQQAAAESGERVSIAVKGFGKLILPMYQGQGNNCPNTVGPPIKMMGGPTTPAKPMKQGHANHNNGHNHTKDDGRTHKNGCNNKHNGTNNKLGNGCGWGNGSLTNNKLFLEKVSGVEIEEESIYAQPNNSQAGSFTITTSTSNPSSLLKSYPKPNSRGEIINWFKEGEIHRSGILLSYGQTNHHSPHIVPQPVTGPIVVSWFFGLINRQQAEELLLGQPTGTFLVRISTRIWGYTLSYQSNNKSKHFLISAINPAVAATLNVGPGGGGPDSKNGPILPTGKQQLLFPFSPGGRYAFIGTNMTPYTTLTSLIRHHSHAPITKTGGEKLLSPCPGGPKIAGIEYVFK